MLFLILSLLLNIALIIGAYFVFRKFFNRIDEYEIFFTEMQNRLIAVLNTMKEIDIRGSFEADDEVGSVFQEMKAMIDALDTFLLEERTGEEENSKKTYSQIYTPTQD